MRVVVQVQPAEVESERHGKLTSHLRVLGCDVAHDAEVGESIDTQELLAFDRLALVGDCGLDVALGDLVFEALDLLGPFRVGLLDLGAQRLEGRRGFRRHDLGGGFLRGSRPSRKQREWQQPCDNPVRHHGAPTFPL